MEENLQSILSSQTVIISITSYMRTDFNTLTNIFQPIIFFLIIFKSCHIQVMCYLTSWILSTAVPSFPLEANTRLSMLLLFSKTAIQCQVYCSTKRFSCRFFFKSEKWHKLRDIFFRTYVFYLSFKLREKYTTIIPSFSHAYFFHN